MRQQPTIERFWNKFEIQESGCWAWVGSLSSNGYGFLWHNGRTIRAHRFAFEHFMEEQIPPDKEIDHLCRNHRCVNPLHMEVVTRTENVIRGVNPELLRQRMLSLTHCRQGHEFSKDNTYIDYRGYRGCIICRKVSNHKAYHKYKTLKDE